MNILIRLDVSKQIGTGHFRRIANLSRYMKNDKFFFLIITDDKNNQLFNGYNIYFTDPKNEADKIRKMAAENSIDIILIDLLHYSHSYIRQIKETTRKKVVTFHEYNDYSDFSDLTINYNFFNGFDTFGTSAFLTGPKYIIFDDTITHFQNIKKENFIFVSFGGSDPKGITEKFINNVAIKLPDITFKVHLGNFNQCENHSKANNIEFLHQPSNLFEYLAASKLAVTAAGNTMYESIFLKTLTFVIAQNNHQDEFATNASKYNCIQYYGLSDDVNFDLLKADIEKAYPFPPENTCFFPLDNLGKHRIAQALKRLVS